MTEPQPSKPNELDIKLKTLYHITRRGYNEVNVPTESEFIQLAREALLNPTTSSGEGETTYSHTDVDGNHEEIETAVNHILYRKVLGPNPNTPVDDKAGDKEDTR